MKLFKKEEKKPISFASVEMKKNSHNSVLWAILLILAIVVLGIFLIKIGGFFT